MCAGIGFLVSGLLIFLVAEKVSGYLPLTSASVRRLSVPMRVSITLLLVALGMFISAVILATTGAQLAQLASLVLASTGLWVFLFGFLGLQAGFGIVKPLYGPTAVVLPRQAAYPGTWIELRNVHPAFVAAVEQQHASWQASLYTNP